MSLVDCPRSLNALSFAAAVAASALAVPALAADIKLYPGAACVGVDPAARDTFSLGANGAIFNFSTAASLNLICPLVKDITKIGGAFVRVTDLDPSGNVVCTLRTMRSDGSIQQQQTAVTSGASNFVQQLTFGAQSAPSTGVGYYALQCTLPLRSSLGPSSVVMYQVSEAD